MIRRFALLLSILAATVALSAAARHAVAQDAAEPAQEAPATAPAGDDAKPKFTTKQNASYGMGMFAAIIVRQMQQQMPPQQRLPMTLPKDEAQFHAGFDAVMSGKDMRLSFAEVQQAVIAYATDWSKQRMAVNQPAEAAFMKTNAEAEGVKVTESGLQYKITTPGEGDHPAATDRVTVHYRGTLLDGTEFDSSHKRGQPATFPLNRVIPGWTEGLQLMKPGGKATLYVPNKLAYGASLEGPGGPGAMLIFEVELIEVAKPEPAATPPSSETPADGDAG